MGILGRPGLMGWSPVGHYIMAFIPCSLPEQSLLRTKNQSFMCVSTAFLLLPKLLTKACISWLDCFVKRTYDHQGEVTPSLITGEKSWAWGGIQEKPLDIHSK